MKARILVSLCVFSLVVCACSDNGGVDPAPDTGFDSGADDNDAGDEPDTSVDESQPAQIVFPTESFVIVENEPVEPTAEVLDGNGAVIEDAFISWESADPSIIHISSGGFALGENPGTTELIATSGDITAHWPAEVVATLIGEVTVIPAEAHLLVGGTISYGVLIEDHHGFPVDDGRPVSWSTTDDSVATIDDQGVATGVGTGSVEVIAVVDDVEARADLTVTDAEVASVAVTPGHPGAIPQGGQLQLQATAYDIEGTPLEGQAAQWSSLDPGVATVSDQGLVVGISQGETTITAEIDGHEDSVDVEVTFEVQSVASGDGFSCAIATNRLFCWGANDRGQLADGSTSARPEAETADFSHSVAQISLGASHGCLIDDDGRVWCWGDNAHGQVGQQAGGFESVPRLVDSDREFRQVAAGHRHSCAVAEGDDIYCWGANDRGQLGSSTGSTHQPRQVMADPDFVFVTAGESHTCAIGSDADAGLEATAYCWGDNSRQQLGGGTTSSSSNSPSVVIGGNQFNTISAGADFTCGIHPSGPPACWGANDRGQLGSTDTTDHAVPRSLALQPGQSLNFITSGSHHSCGNIPGEGPHCWGAYEDGRLGTSTGEDALQPVAIDGDEDFPEIAAGEAHVCGRTPDHHVLCWGGAPADGAQLTQVVF